MALCSGVLGCGDDDDASLPSLVAVIDPATGAVESFDVPVELAVSPVTGVAGGTLALCSPLEGEPCRRFELATGAWSSGASNPAGTAEVARFDSLDGFACMSGPEGTRCYDIASDAWVVSPEPSLALAGGTFEGRPLVWTAGGDWLATLEPSTAELREISLRPNDFEQCGGTGDVSMVGSVDGALFAAQCTKAHRWSTTAETWDELAELTSELEDAELTISATLQTHEVGAKLCGHQPKPFRVACIDTQAETFTAFGSPNVDDAQLDRSVILGGKLYVAVTYVDRTNHVVGFDLETGDLDDVLEVDGRIAALEEADGQLYVVSVLPPSFN